MPGPLDGIRVFDMTVFMVGPWGSMQLGAMGADVIHIEEPGSIHNSQIWVPPHKEGTSIGYISWNLNKRGILLDLKQTEDRDIAYRLLSTCDIFTQNMRPGAATRLGLDYETVAAIKPSIIYISSSGYGPKGPLAQEPATDPVIQAFGGSTSINGNNEGPYELFRHQTHYDATTGNLMAQAALLGLMARDVSGEGQHIDVSMVGASTVLQSSRLAEYFATAANPPQHGSASSTTVPHEAFLCQDQTYLAVGVVKESQWPPLCEELGLSNLIGDTRFCTNAHRVDNRTELLPLLKHAFLKKPRYYWIMRLSQREVPCGKFFDWDELRFHPQVTENNYVHQVDTPWGALWSGGLPWAFSDTPATIRSSPSPGEHMAEILEDLEPPSRSRN